MDREDIIKRIINIRETLEPEDMSLRVESEDDSEKIDLDIPSCWSNLKNDEYAPAYVTVPKVPSGVYEIGWNSNLQTFTLKKQPFKTDELYHLPSYEIMDILKDIDNFWNRVDVYKKYNFIHKRGILM